MKACVFFWGEVFWCLLIVVRRNKLINITKGLKQGGPLVRNGRNSYPNAKNIHN
jgi:hypothetical protein